jgi:2-keto-4-pentenoate hydratase/2-oxohepta-3-ene-1,7-dioic acid hydratase in catechol pathway
VPIRLANAGGRATLVADGRAIDVERRSGGALCADPMAPGDVIESEIEGVGRLRNRCVAP